LAWFSPKTPGQRKIFIVRIVVQAFHASSNSIFFSAASSVAMRELRICPARALSYGNLQERYYRTKSFCRQGGNGLKPLLTGYDPNGISGLEQRMAECFREFPKKSLAFALATQTIPDHGFERRFNNLYAILCECTPLCVARLNTPAKRYCNGPPTLCFHLWQSYW